VADAKGQPRHPLLAGRGRRGGPTAVGRRLSSARDGGEKLNTANGAALAPGLAGRGGRPDGLRRRGRSAETWRRARRPGTLPTRTTLVAERFFDEAGVHAPVVHSPFGSRMNRAWGLAWRKTLLPYLQLRLRGGVAGCHRPLARPTHTSPGGRLPLPPLGDRQGRPRPGLSTPPSSASAGAGTPAVPGALASAAARRCRPSPAPGVEDLIEEVFPDQLACLENIVGSADPRSPLIEQTLKDCLTRPWTSEGLLTLLRAMEAGESSWWPRPDRALALAHEIITPVYTFSTTSPGGAATQAIPHPPLRRSGDRRRPGRSRPRGDRTGARRGWPERRAPTSCTNALMTVGFLTAGRGMRPVAVLPAEASPRRAGPVCSPWDARGGLDLWWRPSGCRSFQALLRGAGDHLTPALTVPPRPRRPGLDLRGGGGRAGARRLQALGPVTPAALRRARPAVGRSTRL